MTVMKIARFVHQVNKAYCESIGDFSQPDWEDAPEWQKESAIAGVKSKLSNPDMTPEKQHQGWYDFKEKDGWVYGPVKDPDNKQHPCMVPYEELPFEQRVKDELFGFNVKTMAKLL